MAKPDSNRTTINVKGVSKDAWERARAMALREDEPMGVWLTGAINHRCDMQAGARELPPAPKPEEKPVEPPRQSLRPEALAVLIQAVAEAYRTAGRPIPPRRLSRMALAADEVFLAARAALAYEPGLAGGQSVTIFGQSAPFAGPPTTPEARG